jgi:hypothetical protein
MLAGGPGGDMAGWFNTLISVLLVEGEDAAMALVQAVNPAVGQQLVPLIEGPVTASEALSYVAVLSELGMHAQAMEILASVVAPVSMFN